MSIIAALALATIPPPPCNTELVVLGAGQDAGAPQLGNLSDPAWTDRDKRLLATSLLLIDWGQRKRFMFEATPDIVEQLQASYEVKPLLRDDGSLDLDGIFLTHAHIGHYAGLLHLGFESANTKDVPVYAMPRMASFLASNAPWSQLIDLNNISMTTLQPEAATNIQDTFAVLPRVVPHRDEFSETVGYSVVTPGKRFFFLPDIDSFDEWEAAGGPSLSALVEGHDLLFLDSTFFDDDELDRDMSAIPHPRTKGTMEALASLPADQRAKVHFIHYNHSNPIRFPDSAESQMVEENGFNVARRGDRHCLDL
ncbi:MBL fold metallo-hydrolase [Sphingomicrobium clamense]|uniref:MBL fold metallo-hydrolase n=1 Tax=Sphingomicrobium clamense TaxID=2851013 RepID=A0ABS6V756_9SPHN|nr:MBL fold metallo-hydrolase [Sphingomicrobium sp. B8]MBW0145410.1 MBL fold metallo-hydrolase [Sphingomicrobium sp. B8]